MVWWLLGEAGEPHKASPEEGFREIICHCASPPNNCDWDWVYFERSTCNISLLLWSTTPCGRTRPSCTHVTRHLIIINHNIFLCNYKNYVNAEHACARTHARTHTHAHTHQCTCVHAHNYSVFTYIILQLWYVLVRTFKNIIREPSGAITSVRHTVALYACVLYVV